MLGLGLDQIQAYCEKNNSITECDSITRMLFKDVY